MVKIFIDPGHGGSDPGAVGNGLKEKDLTLKISKKIEALLKDYKDVEVKLSRTGDTYPSLTDRAKAANAFKADYFISVHINAGGGTGYENYRYSKLAASSGTGKNQSTMHDAIFNEIKSFGVTSRGKKAADYSVLRETNMEAILTENLFIDKAADAKLLKQDKFLDAIAEGHVKGLVKVFNLKKKEVEKPKTEDKTVYKVQVGAFTDKKNAEKLAAELKKQGKDTIIVKK